MSVMKVKVNYAADLVLVNSSVCEDPTLLLDYAPEVRTLQA